MHKPYRLLLPLFVAVAAFAVVRLAFAVPPLPTSFYGTVVVDGAVVAPGTPVTAYIDGVAYATTGTTLDGGQSVFLLHVPGDDPDTGAVEGGTPGATVSFTIGALTAVQTATWQSGVHRERALVAFSVPQPPDAAFVVDKPIAVVGETIAFTDTSTDIDGALVAAGWEFGDGATSTLANPSHAYAAHGVFDVTLTVTDSDGLTDSAVQPVTVRARPVAAFTYAPAAPRAGETVVFTNTATDADGTIVFYSWDFGDGAGSGDADPTHVFATTGTRLVTLTVTDDDGLSDSATMLIPVVEPPDAAFTVATAPAVAGEPVAFIDQSATPFGTLVGWGWDFGDGVGSAAQNPVHVFATHGAYTVTLVVTDSAAFTDTATQTVSVLARPAADFTWDPLAPAVTQTVAFTDASADADGALIAWLWDFDDGATATGPAPTYTFGAVGRYDVHLTVTDTDGLAATALRSVIVSGACGRSGRRARRLPVGSRRRRRL